MLERLKEIIKRVLPDLNMDLVTENSKLVEELGFDSLAIMMLAMEIEEAFDFKFTEFVKFETVGDVCDYLEKLEK